VKINVDGHDVFIDEEDYELVSKYKWYTVECVNTRYVYANIRNKNHKITTTKMHRLITNCPNKLVVDHIDGNGLDNRKGNLRVCKQIINCWNKNVNYKPNYRSDVNKYSSRIRISGKNISLGYCDTKTEAIKRFNLAHNIRRDFCLLKITACEANKRIHSLKERYQKNIPKFIDYFHVIQNEIYDKRELRDCYIDYGLKPKKSKITKKDKDFIKKSKLKQVDLAKKFNISPQYVNDIKKGRIK
jgi:hypothetical protein